MEAGQKSVAGTRGRNALRAEGWAFVHGRGRYSGASNVRDVSKETLSKLYIRLAELPSGEALRSAREQTLDYGGFRRRRSHAAKRGEVGWTLQFGIVPSDIAREWLVSTTVRFDPDADCEQLLRAVADQGGEARPRDLCSLLGWTQRRIQKRADALVADGRLERFMTSGGVYARLYRLGAGNARLPADGAARGWTRL